MNHMDLDRELFLKAEKSQNFPLVRVYQWELPSITHGYNQKIEALINLDHYRGWQIHKRPTGGGIVFHNAGETSFTVILPRKNLNVNQAVALTSKKIAQFLKSLGMNIEIEMAKRFRSADLCTNFVSSFEITLASKKLVGIAQRFGRNVILQQGTIFGKYPEIITIELERCLKDY